MFTWPTLLVKRFGKVPPHPDRAISNKQLTTSKVVAVHRTAEAIAVIRRYQNTQGIADI